MKMNLRILISLCAVATSCLSGISSQTYCALKVPVPNTGYCDAIGILDEDNSAEVHQTKGKIQGMQDYQREAFNIFNQQFHSLLENTKSTDGQIRGIEEEIIELGSLMKHVQTIQEYEERTADTEEAGSSRHKRAASALPSQTQQLLDAAKLAIQQMALDIGRKLQNLTRDLQDDDRRHKALHARLQGELAKNQQDLTTTQQELNKVDAAIQKTLAARAAGNASGSSALTNITRQVTQLAIDGATAEQVAQRQIDNIDKQMKQTAASVAKVDSSLQSLTTVVNDLKQSVNNNTRAVSIIQGAEKQYETQMNKTFSDMNTDIAKLQARTGQVQTEAAKLGSDVLSAVQNTSQVRAEVVTLRKSVDSVQALSTLSTKLQSTQLSDIVSIRRDVTDDINVLKYVFGMLKTLP